MESLKKRNKTKQTHFDGDFLACSHQPPTHATSVAAYEMAIDAYVCRYNIRTVHMMCMACAGNRRTRTKLSGSETKCSAPPTTAPSEPKNQTPWADTSLNDNAISFFLSLSCLY